MKKQPGSFPVGKLPPDVLASMLGLLPGGDPRVLSGPAPGEDAAAIALPDRCLVVKTDPVTFTAGDTGYYAVHINANDVACRGANPRWFLPSVLLPEGSASPKLVSSIFTGIARACRELGVTVIGGHTEITGGLTRPIVAGCMLGEAPRNRLITTAGARPGDRLVLTRGIALEGTALLAREKGERLRTAGVSPAVIRRARRLLRDPGISVVQAARLAVENVPVHAMHDPTEGGLATALHEMARAAGAGLRIRLADVPVLPESADILPRLGLDPLGTLSSGALLLAIPSGSCGPLLALYGRAGIPAAVIGGMLPAGGGVMMEAGGREEPLPVFTVDEITRVL